MTRYYLFSLVLIALISSLFYFTYTYNDNVAGLFSDDAIYLILAELYSPYSDYNKNIFDYVINDSRFPPVYPLVLGLLGADTYNAVHAALINCLILVILISLLSVWVNSEKCNDVQVIAIPVLFALLPGTLIMSQGLWSEFLFMVFLYAAFISNNIIDKPDNRYLLTSLFIGLSILTRAIGVATGIAFILYLLIKRPKNSYIYIIIVSLPYIIWSISKNLISDNPSYFGELSFDLANVFSPEFINVIAVKLNIFIDSWVWLFKILESDGIHYIISTGFLALIFILSVIGFCSRIKHLKLDALTVPFYLAIVFIWPYNDIFYVSRFLYPLLPLFLLYTYIGMNNLFKNYNNYLSVLYILMFVIIAYPSSYQFIERGYMNVDDKLKPYRKSRNWLIETDFELALQNLKFNRSIIETLPKLTEHIPVNECVYAYQTPIIYLHVKRVSSLLPPFTDSYDEFNANTKTCNYFIAMNTSDINNSYPPFYPLQHINNKSEYEVKQFYIEPENKEGTSIFLINRLQNAH